MHKTNLFQTIASNTLSQGTGKVIAIILSLLSTSMLTRHLGQSGYGQYTLIATLVLFFNSISDWGTGFISTRMASQNKYPPSLIYGNLILFRLLASFISSFFMISLAAFKVVELSPPLLIIGSLVLFALTIRNCMQVVFQVHLRLEFGAIVEIISSIIFLLFTYIAVVNSLLNVPVAISILFISSLLSGVVALFFGYRLTSIRYQLQTKILKYLIKEAAPMGALLVVFSIYNRLDSFILQHYQGDIAVGLYGIAYKVHDNLVLGAAFFMNAMYPLISKSPDSPHPPAKDLTSKISVPILGSSTINRNQVKQFADNKSLPAIQSLFATSFHLLLVAGLTVSVFFFLFARQIIYLLAGSTYFESVILLKILLVATFFAYLNHLTGYTLAARGLQKISLFIAVIALIINLVLNFLFIPIYGYYASAVITIVTEGVVLVFSLFYLIRKQNLRPELFKLPTTLRYLLFNRKQLF